MEAFLARSPSPLHLPAPGPSGATLMSPGGCAATATAVPSPCTPSAWFGVFLPPRTCCRLEGLQSPQAVGQGPSLLSPSRALHRKPISL